MSRTSADRDVAPGPRAQHVAAAPGVPPAAGLLLSLLASAPLLRHTHFLPGGTPFAETLRCATVAPGSAKHVTARPATA
jgi:hypothetical protein